MALLTLLMPFFGHKLVSILDVAKGKVSGIRLVNVKRRLNLLYGKDHDLKIERTGQWFTMRLQLKFRT